jgi:hypothetical protein
MSAKVYSYSASSNSSSMFFDFFMVFWLSVCIFLFRLSISFFDSSISLLNFSSGFIGDYFVGFFVAVCPAADFLG